MKRGFRKVRIFALAAVLWTPMSASGQTQIKARAATITVGGRLQVQGASSSHEAAPPFEILLRRARFYFGVEVTEFLEGRLLADFARNDEIGLQDAYVRLNFSPAFAFSMGRLKRPSEIFEMSSSSQLSIIERDGRVRGAGDCTGTGGVCTFSRLTEKLQFSGRDSGFRLAGSAGRFGYTATLTNGTGITVNEDENDAKSYSGRATLQVVDDLELGAFVGVHDYPDMDDSANFATAVGADLDWGGWYDGVHLQAAVVGGDNWKNLDVSGDAGRFLTSQVVFTYYIPVESDKWVAIEPIARISWADPDTDTADDAAWLITPGVSFFISGRNKIGTNLDIYMPEQGGSDFSFKFQSFLYF